MKSRPAICLFAALATLAFGCVTLPDRTEFVKGFAGNNYRNSGLSLKLYWSDGEVTEWDASKDSYVRNEYLIFDTSSIDEDGTVAFTIKNEFMTSEITTATAMTPIHSNISFTALFADILTQLFLLFLQ